MQFHVFYRFQTLGRFLIMCGNIEGYGRINGKSFSYLFCTTHILDKGPFQVKISYTNVSSTLSYATH
jgi:hypothetical protein